MSDEVQPPSANDLYREVQRLIRSGQPVFPCNSGLEGDPKKAKSPDGSLVRNGVKNATLDLDVAKGWWKRNRTAGIGIPTGVLWDVLDVDVKEAADGRVHLFKLAKFGFLNGCQRVVQTPSGGLHLYFRATKGLGNRGRAADLGMDVRAAGGYVLAPGSYIDAQSADGRRYRGYYSELESPVNYDNSPLYWDHIVNNIAPRNDVTNKPIDLLPAERRSSIAALREFVSELSRGERNNGFFWAVCRCVEAGIDPNELAEAASLTGLDEEEIRKSIGSALKTAGVQVEQLDSEMEAMFPDID